MNKDDCSSELCNISVSYYMPTILGHVKMFVLESTGSTKRLLCARCWDIAEMVVPHNYGRSDKVLIIQSTGHAKIVVLHNTRTSPSQWPSRCQDITN